MFKRLWMAVRSFFGLFVRGMENPELMLQQYMDDMRGRVPKMNNTVAEVMKTEFLVKNQIERQEKKAAELDQQVIAAVKLGPNYEAEAKSLISALETAKGELVENKQQYETAKKASEQAKIAREDFIRTMNEKIQEAMHAINKSKQAAMQEQLAGLMASFETGDESDVLDRMTQKIDERAARAQARVELATTGVDARLHEIKRATEQVGVDDKLLEYKRQLGMLPEEPTGEKVMQPVSSTEQSTQTETPQPTVQPQQTTQ